MKRCLALTMCLLLPAALALADGDGPTRKMTGPEAAAFNALKSAFEKEKRVSAYTRYNLRNANLGVPTKPRGMAVVVAGPKEKPQSVHDFLGQIDLAKMKAGLP
jgi:hypothetical protein